MKRIIIALGALGIMATSAAASSTPGIDHREHRQLHRITKGIQNGSLNRQETARLLRHQVHIQRLEQRAKADGVVTRHERHRIRAAQNRQNRAIWRNKHDWN
jgi:hypothetical protein